MIIDISVKERNVIDNQNNDIKKIFTKPLFINDSIVGDAFTSKGLHMIKLNTSNKILDSISIGDNILSWDVSDIYSVIKENKKKIQYIKIEDNVISFTDNEEFNENIMKISNDNNINKEAHDAIHSFLSKKYDEYVLSEDDIDFLAENTMYSKLDVRYNVLRYSKAIIPTFKCTKKERSSVKICVQEVENNADIVKILFIVTNIHTTSFHMYAMIKRYN